MEVIFMSIKKEEIPGDINLPDIKSEPDENCMDVVEGETGDCSDTSSHTVTADRTELPSARVPHAQAHCASSPSSHRKQNPSETRQTSHYGTTRNYCTTD